MLDNQRMNLLYQNFITTEQMPEEVLDQLTLEELSFLYALCESSKKNEKLKDSNINFAIKEQIIYWAAVARIKDIESIYVVHTKAPDYPYIDPTGAVWMFSTQQCAEKLVADFAKKQFMQFVIHKIDKPNVMGVMTYLYYLGVDKLIIDNGSHPLPMNRTDIHENPVFPENAKGADFSNSNLQLSLIQFFQYVQLSNAHKKKMKAEDTPEDIRKALEEAEPNDLKIMRMLETRMLGFLVDAKFLVPSLTLVNGQPLPPGQTVPAGEGVTRKVANLLDGQKTPWLPAFTDWTEFRKLYKVEEWGAMVVPYETLLKLAGDTGLNRIIFNAAGCAFRVDEKLMANIENFRAKKAEIEAKKASEQGAPAAAAVKAPTAAASVQKSEESAIPSGQVSYGEVLDTPDMMVMALKRTAKALKTVKKMWLASRIEGNETGYLLVVDSSDASNAIEELKKAAAGYVEGVTLETRSADPIALDLVKNIKPFYKKGLFG